MGASPTLSQLLSRAESSPCGGRRSGGLSPVQLAPAVPSDTHTLVTPSRGVGVAAATIPVTRCRCAQSAAYHTFVCATVDSLLHMHSTYVANTPHCLCLQSSVEYQLRCARLVCYADLLLRNYSLCELSLLRNSSALRTRCFAPARRVTR